MPPKPDYYAPERARVFQEEPVESGIAWGIPRPLLP